MGKGSFGWSDQGSLSEMTGRCEWQGGTSHGRTREKGIVGEGINSMCKGPVV